MSGWASGAAEGSSRRPASRYLGAALLDHEDKGLGQKCCPGHPLPGCGSTDIFKVDGAGAHVLQANGEKGKCDIYVQGRVKVNWSVSAEHFNFCCYFFPKSFGHEKNFMHLTIEHD